MCCRLPTGVRRRPWGRSVAEVGQMGCETVDDLAGGEFVVAGPEVNRFGACVDLPRGERSCRVGFEVLRVAVISVGSFHCGERLGLTCFGGHPQKKKRQKKKRVHNRNGRAEKKLKVSITNLK